jgi:immune inhibitor A
LPHHRKWLRLLALAGACVLVAVPSAQGATDPDSHFSVRTKQQSDNILTPISQRHQDLREEGLWLKLRGAFGRDQRVGRVTRHGRTKYVELARQGEDSIFTLLVEFGDQQATHNHGAAGTINHGGTPGPVHNQIPQPDRSQDNTTIWTADFNRPHYLDMLFSEGRSVNSMRQFYIEQSSNRYAVNGDVTDWTRVQFNEAAYGSNYCGSIVCTRDIQRLLEDGLNQWYANQIAAGQTPAQVNAYLSRFDTWDRYDYDTDGNYAEPDGYLDHFQTIHAGEGEETGGGAQGTDAIWSHRSQTNVAGIGSVGPSFNKFGGAHIGSSDYWVFDYTIEPENGGVGVFAHEFGHDLGLPDEYDTSGNTGGAENSTGFWTIMSSGSYGNDGTQDIGSKPIGFSAWDKLQLGWLDYDQAAAGSSSKHKLGPTDYNTRNPQAVVVTLPPSLNTTSTQYGTPTSGANAWHSDAGNNLDVTMSHPVTLPNVATITASFKAWYEIEGCWDYAYLRVSADNGATWTNVHTSVSDAGNENGQNFGEGITGISGAPKACDVASGNPAWVSVTADLSAFKGQSVLVGFRYWTDGAAGGRGFEFDDLAITAGTTTVFSEGAENGDNGWTIDGWTRTTGVDVVEHDHYYIVENREYVGYDNGLRTGPYNFSSATMPDYAERFSYQNGVVIWYWNTAFANNNVGDHPGQGQILPVDAHPELLHWSDGSLVRPRIQSFDTAFSTEHTKKLTLHKPNGATLTVPARPATSVFNDRASWWTASDGHPHGTTADDHYMPSWLSVRVPQSGTQVKVKKIADDGVAQIEIGPAR